MVKHTEGLLTAQKAAEAAIGKGQDADDASALTSIILQHGPRAKTSSQRLMRLIDRCLDSGIIRGLA